MYTINEKKPDSGQRVILIRDGEVVPLMPIFSRRTEYMGSFHKDLVIESWEFPTDPSHYMTEAYAELYNLKSPVWVDDVWMPLPDLQ